MKADAADAGDRAAALRAEFDHGFAAPAGTVTTATEDLLALRIAGEGYALRLSAIAGLYADRRIVRLPGAGPELLGLAGLRGSLVAAYDLRALLGYPPGEQARWVALVRGESTVGLAFEELEGYLRVAFQDVVPAAAPRERGHVQEVVGTGRRRCLSCGPRCLQAC